MQTVLCEGCGNSFSAGMRVCPHCNAVRRLPQKVHKEPLCPRCGILLEQRQFRAETLDQCPQCLGLWLDTDEFKFLTSERDSFADPNVPRRFHRSSQPDLSALLTCVRCEHLMTRRNFELISGVFIDACRDCGCWLDSGELQKLRAFVANGGLDESRNRRIDENQNAIRSTQSNLKETRFYQKLANRSSLRGRLLNLARYIP